MSAVVDDPLPLLRRERQVDHDALEVVGNEVAGQVRVRQRVLDGIEDAAIGACGVRGELVQKTGKRGV
jgi:hypothetical protein